MASCTFTEAAIRRAVKGAIEGGLRLSAIEIEKDGTIRLLHDLDKKVQADPRKPEKW